MSSTASVPLYNRQFLVNVGGIQISSTTEDPLGKTPSLIHKTLRIAFHVEHSTKKDPNTADLTIWNLSAESRKQLHTDKPVAVRIEAGYAGQVFIIFRGDLAYMQSQKQGADWVTKLQAGDGQQKLRSSRINESLGPGTTVIDAAKKAADSLGLDLGNFIDKVNQGKKRGAIEAFPRGITLSGSAQQQFDKMMRLLGFEWFVLDGKVQLMAPNEALDETIVLLDATSGLVGSPERGEKGHVKARSLLQPDLFPGRKVKLDARDTKGTFRIEKSKFAGDTWGQEWYVDLELKPL